jgi:hypothetical protein
MREVGLSIYISPVEVFGKIIFADVRVGKRRSICIANLVTFHELRKKYKKENVTVRHDFSPGTSDTEFRSRSDRTHLELVILAMDLTCQKKECRNVNSLEQHLDFGRVKIRY